VINPLTVMIGFITHIYTFVLSFLTAIRQFCEEPPLWFTILLVRITHPSNFVVKVPLFVYYLYNDNTLMIIECILYFLTSALLFTDWPLFFRLIRGFRFPRYQLQSGNYGKSKYHARSQAVYSKKKKELTVIQEKTRQCQNAGKDKLQKVVKIKKDTLKKMYTPHVGSDFWQANLPFIGVRGRNFHTFFFVIEFFCQWWMVNCPRLFISVLRIFFFRDFVEERIRNQLNYIQQGLDIDFQMVRTTFNVTPRLSLMWQNCTTLHNLSKFDMNNIEKWAALVTGLVTSTNLSNASALLFLHFKTYYNESISKNMIDYFMQVMGGEEYQPQSMEAIVSVFKQCLKDWKSLRSSKLFVRITDVIALVVSSGLCKAANLEFSLLGVPLFSESLRKRIDNANIMDVSQMMLEAVAYFIEMGYVCFSQGSLRPILFDDVEAFSYDEKMLLFLRVTPMVCDGDWNQANITYDGYCTLYDDLHNYLKTVYVSIQKGPEKKIVWDKMVNIARLKNDFDRRHNAGSMRCAPYVLCVCGPSSVGKTSVAGILNIVAVKASGGTGDQAKKITWNEGDDYFSNYKSDTETIVMDDMCNTKANFLQNSPVAQLIKFNNNNPEYAVMADLESKGKISIRPKTVVITTNVPDLMATVYSNEPVSILRRLNIRISVKVKQEFAVREGTGNYMLDPIKASEYCSTLSGSDALYPDMWELTAEKCISVANPTLGLPDVATFVPIVCPIYGKELVNVSIATIAIHIAHAAKQFSDTQRHIVSKQTIIHNEVIICPLCHSLDIACTCLMHEHTGDDAQQDRPIEVVEIQDPLIYTPEFDENFGVSNIHPIFDEYIYPFFRELLTWRFVGWLLGSILGNIFNILTWLAVYLMTIFSIGSSYALMVHGFGAIYTFIVFWRHVVLFYLNFQTARLRWRRYRRYILNNAPVRTMREVVRTATPLLGHLIVLRILYICIKSGMKLLRSKTFSSWTEHSALQPDETEYAIRRSSANPWTTLPMIKLKDVKPKVKTTDYKDLNKIVQANLVHVKAGTQVVGGFFIKTHFLLIPQHFFKEDNMELMITPQGSIINSHRYRVKISRCSSVFFPGTDLVLVYAPGGTDKRDLVDYIPNCKQFGRVVASFSFRNKDGSLLEEDVAVNFGRVETVAKEYDGGHYSFSHLKTFCGMCMGTFVSNTKTPHIIGFHLGGLTDTPHGCLGYVTRDNIVSAIEVLSGVPGICPTASLGDVPTVMYESHTGGTSFMLDKDIAPRCPTRFLRDDASITVLGSCLGGVTNKSSVIVSHISESVIKYLGKERTHGPAPMGYPDVPSWHNWALGMEGFSTPAVGPNPGEIIVAVNDYLHGLLCVDFSKIEPLSMDKIVNGLDGDRFLNRMPQNTSVGFPISGKLARYCHQIDSTQDHSVRFAVNDEILGVYHEYIRLYEMGQRAYPIFRASLKDEPVKIGKLKVRVFQAAPVALKMVLRQYFLPLAAHLSMFPLQSECAVGINAFSSEWGEMMEHIETNGDCNIVAGDYSAYDQRMPASLTGAAFDILMELAARANYRERDLRIMRSVIADVIYPLLAYNGTLVMLHGGNPSGHNLTVYINSIVNSLISRCAFRSIYPRTFFRDAVSMMTYGDDDIGSVNIRYDGYNNISKSDYINSIGMKYTPPSKSGEHIKFLSLCDVDFLKRHDLFNADLGRRVGVLAEESVYKSLHARMRSTEVTDQEWAGSVVDGALRELAPRGKEYYERVRHQLSKVALDHNFALHSINLHCTYEEMVDKIA